MNDAAKQQKQATPRTAITPTRADNFPEWYQEVIKEAELAENSPVRGCMIIKPYGYALWENIQRALDDMIRDVGVKNAYFPLLIPVEFIAREAEHVDGFAKECAIVTHHRLMKNEKGQLVPDPESKLEEPFVIRPTSETIIGDSMARWIQSYRDMPLLLNQWANVMRWEMRTRMFLRTAEFLWQEGHNAFETDGEALDDAMKMIHVYNDLYQNFCAIYGVIGEKTPDERFPGAKFTYTIEAMMQDGKALQACTSHHLGQNFAHSCGIKFQGRDGKEHFAHTTSWGLSTRSIGGLIMSHGDDDGLIMPPRLAPTQVQIIPIFKDEDTEAKLKDYSKKLCAELKKIGIRAEADFSDARSADKMWRTIKKGVPVRVEIGGREMEQNSLTFVCRDLGKESKETVTLDTFVLRIPKVLDDMHHRMFEKSKQRTLQNIFDVKNASEIKDFFKANKIGFVRLPASMVDDEAVAAVKKEFSLTSRCLPFEDKGEFVLIGKSY
jgi:prolyl-tRNA synthetase